MSADVAATATLPGWGKEVLGRTSPTLAVRAYRLMRDRLVMLDIAPGAPINEQALAVELGVGRTSVRECLKLLELDHLVVSHLRRGSYATQVDIADLAAVSEMRVALEPVAARRAALTASPERRSGLFVRADQIELIDLTQIDQRALIEYDVAVHRLIYAAAGNSHLEETLVRLDNLATRIWCLLLDRLPTVDVHLREHVDLLRAIAEGDADRAADLSRSHITHFEASILQVL